MQFIRGSLIEVISGNLHKLEELYLNKLCDHNVSSIECLVSGCPKLKILHVGWEDSALHIGWEDSTESARCLLLGLPNLIEFQHPAMVPALEQIIKDGKSEAVSALRNLYIDDGVYSEFDRVLKSAQVVMNHLGNITKLDITESNNTCNDKSTGLQESISKLTCLTHLNLMYFSSYTHVIVPTIRAVGHHLRVLDVSCDFFHDLYDIGDAIDQCRELRILRVSLQGWNKDHKMDSVCENYGNDLMEEFTPFCYLHEMLFEGLNQSYLKSTLFKSLIASPRLQELRLVDVPNLTDHVLKAAFNHTNDEGEQLAFTSLRKLSVVSCDLVTNYLESVVTDEKIPLDSLEVLGCCNVTDVDLWNLERFEMNVVHDDDDDDDEDDGLS